MKKIVKESLAHFKEDSDPIIDMGIGTIHPGDIIECTKFVQMADRDWDDEGNVPKLYSRPLPTKRYNMFEPRELYKILDVERKGNLIKITTRNIKYANGWDIFIGTMTQLYNRFNKFKSI